VQSPQVWYAGAIQVLLEARELLQKFERKSAQKSAARQAMLFLRSHEYCDKFKAMEKAVAQRVEQLLLAVNVAIFVDQDTVFKEVQEHPTLAFLYATTIRAYSINTNSSTQCRKGLLAAIACCVWCPLSQCCSNITAAPPLCSVLSFWRHTGGVCQVPGQHEFHITATTTRAFRHTRCF
jgi:hypothetical protein